MQREDDAALSFYGGKIGSWVPLGSLILFMLALVVTDHISLKVFWTSGFFALCTSFLFAKDRNRMSRIVLRGLTDPMFSTLVMIFFLAGILSHLLRQSGLINGLLWLSTSIGLNPAYMPVVTFLTCVIISTACGTAGGTIAAATPIMLPLSVGLGCNPALVMGAIVSGAFFGDNLAPISDTTIASATMMEQNVGVVVRNRLPYSILAGLIASGLYIFMGQTINATVAGTAQADPEHAKTLIMLLIPVVMVFLMLKGQELVSVLLICDMLAIVLNLGMGFLNFADLFTVKGPIVAGIEGMLSIVCFEVFLFALLALTRSSGAFDQLLVHVIERCRGPKQAEMVTAGLVGAATIMTVINTVAIVVVGPIANRLYRNYGLDRSRGANVLDGISCGMAGVIPYNASMMTMYSLAVASGSIPDSFSILSVPRYSFHCILLLVVFGIAILTGWNRKKDIEAS